MSPRRLVALLHGLPDRSRTKAPDGWNVDRELAAQAVERIDGLTVLTELVHTQKKDRSKVRKPNTLPRPWDDVTPDESAYDRMARLARGFNAGG